MNKQSVRAGWIALQIAIGTVFVGVAFLPRPGFAQGSLNPPGAPAPNFKTLQQIEPRTPISTLPFTITASGSYYLTTNLTGGAGNGIVILASRVSLDLQEFELVGGSGNGVLVSSAQTNLWIRSGTVRGWGTEGIDAGTAQSNQFEKLFVAANGGNGLQAGLGAVVRDCTAHNNQGDGISVNGGSLVTECVSRNNLGAAFFTNNISVVASSTVDSNGGDGIVATGSIVRDCLVTLNTDDGIEAIGGCHIHRNPWSNTV